MNQALAKLRVQATTTAIIIIITIVVVVIVIINKRLSHHDIRFANLALLLRHRRRRRRRLRPHGLLRTLRGRVPRVIGARTELLLAVRVLTRVAVAAGPRVAPEVGAEARLPQRR